MDTFPYARRVERLIHRQWMTLVFYAAITVFVIWFCAGRSYYGLMLSIMRFHGIGSLLLLIHMTVVTIIAFHLQHRASPRFNSAWLLHGASLAGHFLFVTACGLIVYSMI